MNEIQEAVKELQTLRTRPELDTRTKQKLYSVIRTLQEVQRGDLYADRNGLE